MRGDLFCAKRPAPIVLGTGPCFCSIILHRVMVVILISDAEWP